MSDKVDLKTLRQDKFIKEILGNFPKEDRAHLRRLIVGIFQTSVQESYSKLLEYKLDQYNKKVSKNRPKYPFEFANADRLSDERYLELSKQADEDFAKWDAKRELRDQERKALEKSAKLRAEQDAIEQIHKVIKSGSKEPKGILNRVEKEYKRIIVLSREVSKETLSAEREAAAEERRNAAINEAGYDPSKPKNVYEASAVDEMERRGTRDKVGFEDDFVDKADKELYDKHGLEIIERNTSYPEFVPDEKLSPKGREEIAKRYQRGHFASPDQARKYLLNLIESMPDVESQENAKRALNNLMKPDAKGNRVRTIDIADQVKTNQLADKSKDFASSWYKNIFPKTNAPTISEPAGPEVANIGTAEPLKRFRGGKPMEIDMPSEGRVRPQDITHLDLGITPKQMRILDRVFNKAVENIELKKSAFKSFLNLDWKAIHAGDRLEMERAGMVAYHLIESHQRLLTNVRNFRSLKRKFGITEVASTDTPRKVPGELTNLEQVQLYKASRGDVRTRAAINFDIRYSIPFEAHEIDSKGKPTGETVSRSIEVGNMGINSTESEVKKVLNVFHLFSFETHDERAINFAKQNLLRVVENELTAEGKAHTKEGWERLTKLRTGLQKGAQSLRPAEQMEEFKASLHGASNAFIHETNHYLSSHISEILDAVAPIDGASKTQALLEGLHIKDFVKLSALNPETKDLFMEQMSHIHGCTI